MALILLPCFDFIGMECLKGEVGGKREEDRKEAREYVLLMKNSSICILLISALCYKLHFYKNVLNQNMHIKKRKGRKRRRERLRKGGEEREERCWCEIIMREKKTLPISE